VRCAVDLAGLINALQVAGKEIDSITLTTVGAGAVGGASSDRGEGDLGCRRRSSAHLYDRHQRHLAGSATDFSADDPRAGLTQITNGPNRCGGIPEALVGSDVCIALSRPGPDTIKAD
jgi:malate dehydrogenase (oxaloacetate-decarboxylating)